ncbi:kinase-like domain-containing protein [Fusarium solani]|uniref:Kinase-like domain-containing protein n=1 Tax=Fusarium solani TaxID=169388 RepID=A0A9P9KCV8_FUSSL|nr:kinase-like domain-containing protein [Fusarium solani]KAH7248369.1 kinase-like domain-containing protein [Fusarium solani]
MTPEEARTALQMDHRKPTGATDPTAKSRVRKAISRTPAAQWNRTMLKELQTILDRNPEVDLQSCFKPTYLKKLTMLKNPPLPRRPQNDDSSVPKHHAIRSRLNLKDQATIIAELSTEVEALLQSGRSLSETLVNLLENGELLYEGAAASVMVFKLNENIAVKVTSKAAAITEQRSLLYLREHLPNFPAPRPHGLVSLGVSYLLFTTFIPGRDLEKVWPQLNDSEKRVISDQLEFLFLQLRSLSCPVNTPLGGIGGEGCKDLRRGIRTNADPIMNENEFQDFIFSGSKTASSSYIGFLRSMMPKSPTKIVFTHGDVRPANIMVERVNSDAWEVVCIIDWEASGHYPEYWECIKATNNLTPRDDSDWYQYLPSVISPNRYAAHWLVDRVWDPSMVNS